MTLIIPQQKYELTDEDVARYLMTKGDEESVGIGGNTSNCLIAEAWRHKYPDLYHICIRVDIYCCYSEKNEIIQGALTPRQKEVVKCFDTIYKEDGRHITRDQFLQAWNRDHSKDNFFSLLSQ